MGNIPVYKIDADVPVPTEPEVMSDRFPLTSLEVNESFEFPSADRAFVQSMASTLKKRKGLTFTVRKISDDAARVWRTS